MRVCTRDVRILTVPLILAAACGSPTAATDGASRDASSDDAAPGDAVHVDAAPTDAGPSCAAAIAALRSTHAGDMPSTQRAALLAAGGQLGDAGTTYFVVWLPDGWSGRADRRLMFDLHGTGGRPEYEWYDWHAALADRAIGFVGLYYFDPVANDYADDATIAGWIDAVWATLDPACDLSGATVALAGFSRGSAEAFALDYRDLHGPHRFAGVLHNAGAWLIGGALPPTLAAADARGETDAFAGSREWMYCGGQDQEHGYPMCDEMTMARDYVLARGAAVEPLYENPTGAHWSLTTTPAAVAAALDWLDAL